MVESFSKRNCYHQVQEVDISIREDAPNELRGFILQLAYECNYSPSILRSIFCSALRKLPDKNNWSDFPNIDDEVRELIFYCKWYKVYDLIENIVGDGISINARRGEDFYDIERFKSELNDYFLENGIGWTLLDGLIQTRGSQHFQSSINYSIEALDSSGLNTAHNELREALLDLSRRPNPDITGAIHHAMGALESTARKICGNDKLTLGELIKRNTQLFPRPLDEAVSKAWGFASESGRHIKEGGTASHEEALLIVGLSSTLCMYLSAKCPQDA